MKRFITVIVAALIGIVALAQNSKNNVADSKNNVADTKNIAADTKNNSADSIVGRYESVQGSDAYKVQVTRNANGSYRAQLFWVSDDKDPKTGGKRLDPKNPDKALRGVACDKIVLFDGLTYDATKKNWSGTKIYDPQRGIRANVTCTFGSDGRLGLKGTVLGISETAYWTPIQ